MYSRTRSKAIRLASLIAVTGLLVGGVGASSASAHTPGHGSSVSCDFNRGTLQVNAYMFAHVPGGQIEDVAWLPQLQRYLPGYGWHDVTSPQTGYWRWARPAGGLSAASWSFFVSANPYYYFRVVSRFHWSSITYTTGWEGNGQSCQPS